MSGSINVAEEHLMRVLVTGASGFLGSAIVHHAAAAGLQVRAMYRRDAVLPPNVEYCRADLLDPESLVPALSDREAVIHAGGLAHIFNKPKACANLFNSINVAGTTNLALAAARAGVRHFLLISSVSVYGHRGAIVDEKSACRPKEPYAQSKWLAEQSAIQISRETGMRLTILRLATVYGEGDPGNVVRLMRTIDHRRFVWVGEGANRKSLIYRDDAARVCLMALFAPGEGINIYNISAPPRTMRVIVEGLASALGRNVPRWQIPASLALYLTKITSLQAFRQTPLNNLHTTMHKWLAEEIYSSKKAQKELNFFPQVDLADGLHREVAWYRKQQFSSTSGLTKPKHKRCLMQLPNEF